MGRYAIYCVRLVELPGVTMPGKTDKIRHHN